MSLRSFLKNRLGLWPQPTDVEAVRKMTAQEWATADRKPTYLPDYLDGGPNEKGQRRAEWLAGLDVWQGVGDVLELGCGAGRNLAALQRRRQDALGLGGVDINAAALAEAQRAVPF